jgi:hypothetical protein
MNDKIGTEKLNQARSEVCCGISLAIRRKTGVLQ